MTALSRPELRALLAPLGRQPIDVTAKEAEAMLEPFKVHLESDFAICCDVADALASLVESGGERARAELAEQASEGLHLETPDE